MRWGEARRDEAGWVRRGRLGEGGKPKGTNGWYDNSTDAINGFNQRIKAV